jgi:predicted dehydrogenase
MKKYHVALIGYGYWGKIIHNILQKMNYVNVVAIYNRNLEKELEDSIFTNDVNNIITNQTITDVFICTPTNTHFYYANLFLNNGKNVFCEKPLSIKNEEIINLIKTSYLKKLKLFTDYTFIFNPNINKLKKLIAFENIQLIEINFKQFGKFYNEHVWYTLGPHALSMLSLFCDLKINKANFISLLINSKNHVTKGEIIINTKDITSKIHLSLYEPKKSREIKIFCNNKTFEYDLLNEKIYIYLNDINNQSILDETINLITNESLNKSIEFFLNSEFEEVESNTLLTKQIGEILSNLNS